MPSATTIPAAGTIAGGKTSAENRAFYRESGYLVAPQMLSGREIEEIREETLAIFRGGRGDFRGLVPPSPGETDFETLRHYMAIQFPHKISETMKSCLHHPGVVDALVQLVSPNVKCVQSMFFVKAPGKPGQAWHQDEYYVPTRDKSLTGVWIAVDDATRENGCLWIVPGSHKPGYLFRREPYQGPDFADVDNAVFPYGEEEQVPVEVKAGTVVFFNGYTLHMSRRNTSAGSFRRALVNHYMSAESVLPWNWKGVFENQEDMRDITMVAGQDPYAWKGYADLTFPFLKSETGAY